MKTFRYIRYKYDTANGQRVMCPMLNNRQKEIRFRREPKAHAIISATDDSEMLGFDGLIDGILYREDTLDDGKLVSSCIKMAVL